MALTRYKWLGLLVALTAGAIVLRLTVSDISPLLAGFVAAAVMLLAVAILIKDMAQHDEASREAHKTSWYWGATAGIAVSGAALALMMASRSTFAQLPAVGPSDPLGYFAAGALATMLVQLGCYVLAWAGWWISKR